MGTFVTVNACGSKSCMAAGTCPTDNPVATLYGNDSVPAWTMSFNWSCVFDVNDYSGAPQEKIESAMKAASGVPGGGVVYLPAGDYALSSVVTVPSNVVLRGVPTTDAARNGMKPGPLAPKSKVTCPEYSHMGFFNNDPKAENLGLVALELDGCAVMFWPGLSGVPSSYSTYPSLLKSFYYATDVAGTGSNKLLLSIKVHDVSYGYPDPTTKEGNEWPWRFSTAVAVYGDNSFVANVLVAEGTLSKKVTLNLKDSGKPVTFKDVTYPIDNRYGIDLGRVQLGGVAGQYAKEGKCKTVPANDNLTPKCAPWFFPTGCVLRDSYVFQNGRVALSVSSGSTSTSVPGSGTQVIANSAFIKPGTTLYSVDGVNQAGGSDTNENRFLDQGGYYANISLNTAAVNRQKTPGGYMTVDGEGVLAQAASNSDMWYTVWSHNDLAQADASSGYMLAYKLSAPSHNIIINNKVLSTENIGCLPGNGGNCGSGNHCADNSPKCEGF